MGFSVIGLATKSLQFIQLMNWCRPSWLTRTMCLLWQRIWKNNLEKNLYYSTDFTFVVVLWDFKKFSNQSCKGRVCKDLPIDWNQIWAFHRKKKKMKRIILLISYVSLNYPLLRNRFMTSHFSIGTMFMNLFYLKNNAIKCPLSTFLT